MRFKYKLIVVFVVFVLLLAAQSASPRGWMRLYMNDSLVEILLNVLKVDSLQFDNDSSFVWVDSTGQLMFQDSTLGPVSLSQLAAAASGDSGMSLIGGYGIGPDSIQNNDSVYVDLFDLYISTLRDTTVWDTSQNIVYVAPTSAPDSVDDVLWNTMDSVATLSDSDNPWDIILLNGTHRPRDQYGSFQLNSNIDLIGQSSGNVFVVLEDYDLGNDAQMHGGTSGWDDADDGLFAYENYLSLMSNTKIKNITFVFNQGFAPGRNKYVFTTGSNVKNITIDNCEFYFNGNWYQGFNFSGVDSNLCFINNYITTGASGKSEHCINIGQTGGVNKIFYNNVISGWEYAVWPYYTSDPSKLDNVMISNNVFYKNTHTYYTTVSIPQRSSDSTFYLRTHNNRYYDNGRWQLFYDQPQYVWSTNAVNVDWTAGRRVDIVPYDYFRYLTVTPDDDTLWVGGYDPNLKIYSNNIVDDQVLWTKLSDNVRNTVLTGRAKSGYYITPGIRLKMDSTAKGGWFDDKNNYEFEINDSTLIREDSYDSLQVVGTSAYFHSPTGYGGARLTLEDKPSLKPSDGFFVSCWFRQASTPNYPGYKHILATKGKFPGTVTDDSEWALYLNYSQAVGLSQLIFEASYDSINYVSVNDGPFKWGIDSLMYVAAWYNPDSAAIYLTTNPYDTVYSTGCSGVYDNDNLLSIGSRKYGGTIYNGFDGWMDEFVFLSGLYPDDSLYTIARDFYDAGLNHTEWDSTSYSSFDSTNIDTGGIARYNLSISLWDTLLNLPSPGSMIDYLIYGTGFASEGDMVKNADTLNVDQSQFLSTSYEPTWDNISNGLQDIILGAEISSIYRQNCDMRMMFDSTAKGGYVDDVSGLEFTIEGTATNVAENDYDVMQVLGESIEFTNGAHYAQVMLSLDDCNELASNSGFYVQFWAEFDALGSDRILLSKGSPFATNRNQDEWEISIPNNGNSMQFNVSWDGVSGETINLQTLGESTLQIDSVYFFAAWYNPDLSTIYFTSNPNDTIYSSYNANLSTINDNSNDLWVGARRYGGLWDGFDGRMDELLFFSGYYPTVDNNYQMVKDFYNSGFNSVEWDTTKAVDPAHSDSSDAAATAWGVENSAVEWNDLDSTAKESTRHASSFDGDSLRVGDYLLKVYDDTLRWINTVTEDTFNIAP